MTTPKPAATSTNILLILLVVALAGIGAVLYLVLRPGEEKQEAIVSVIEARDVEEAKVNVMDVIDAIERTGVNAVEGQRYKVLITDEAREGASGITRIGGMVTFVPGVRSGDVAVIEVTRVKRTTADAILIETLERGRPVLDRAERPRREERSYRDDDASELVGQVFRGTITDTGREGDGVTHVNGKVVFVSGAVVGEHVEYRITADSGRFARAEVVSKSDTPFEDVQASKPEARKAPDDVAARDESSGAPVAVGEEYEVVVSEANRRNPDRDGVARINNMVVFIPDTRVGDLVRIRITDVRARAADAEVLERMGAANVEP